MNSSDGLIHIADPENHGKTLCGEYWVGEVFIEVGENPTCISCKRTVNP